MSLLAKSASQWHRGEGEPRATNGQAQKIPCRPPLVNIKLIFLANPKASISMVRLKKPSIETKIWGMISI